MENNQHFWHSKESETAKVYYSGKVMSSTTKEGDQGDLIITQKGEIFKFIYGSKNTSKEPYLKYIEKIKVSKFPFDDNIKINNIIWSPLGDATIYKLDNGEFYWEY